MRHFRRFARATQLVPAGRLGRASDWTKIGTISVGDAGLLWLGDPTLAPRAEEGLVLRVSDKELDAYVQVTDFAGDTRVSRFRISSSNQLDDVPMSTVGTVWTDTALLAAVSPAIAEQLNRHQDMGTLDKALIDVELFGVVSLENPFVELIVVSTGFGDGEYALTTGVAEESTLLDVVFIHPGESYPFERQSP